MSDVASRPHTHSTVVHKSAELYRWHLEDIWSADRRRGRALTRLISALETATTAREIAGDVISADSRYYADLFATFGEELVDEYSLGVGWDGAPVIVMGTEAADDLRTWQGMAFQCLYPILLLGESHLELVQRAYAASGWDGDVDWSHPRRPYHLNPNDFVDSSRPRPGRKRVGRHTWSVVASAVSLRGVGALLNGPRDQPGLGERAYQIERSAASALTAGGGRPPSTTRCSFLCEVVMPALRDSATVLLMHGFGAKDQHQWDERSGAIASAFLGCPVHVKWEPRDDGQWLFEANHGGRRFIWCRALNGNVKSAYLDKVRDLVLEAAPET